MAALFLAGVAVAYAAEAGPNPALRGLPVDQGSGNLEGKEVRFGVAGSALFATVTTDASCGAINAMHDSFTPLGGLVPLVNMKLGEVVFGGVGAGLYGILVFALLAVFIAGLGTNTVFWNTTMGLAMLIGRFGMMLPVLALAGSMVDKRVAPPGPGTFPTSGPLFAGMLVAVIVVVSALTFFPTLCLGPIIEHFVGLEGRLF
jgi:K+-transporting ATPase ATPase A chain